jgi:hypothetical protein
MQAAGARSIILEDGGRCVRSRAQPVSGARRTVAHPPAGHSQRVLQSSTGCAGLLYKVSQPAYEAPLSYANDTRGFHRTALQSATPQTSHTKENAE